MIYLLNDLQLAKQSSLKPIKDIAKNIGIGEERLYCYGDYIAKIDYKDIVSKIDDPKLVLVTASHPTPAGEGKTTLAIGLADALNFIGENACLALREPSLGPVFGIKGGATGGGYTQVLPMEDINLHFTGDIHAISSANNLLVSMLDNHIQQGNNLNIDPRSVCIKHCVDLNDRQLRNIISGIGGDKNGIPREDGFVITAASQVMASLCMASSLSDLRKRLGDIFIAKTYDGKYIYAKDIKANGAMTALLVNAFKPNLVQTISHTPCLMHGGPFANIAHGCNSIMATRLAMKLVKYTVTEAGFASDLGAEKFMDIKCRNAGIYPDCIVLVSTIRAIKYQGGSIDFSKEDTDSISKGFDNLLCHYNRLKNNFGTSVIVAINEFSSDTLKEKKHLESLLNQWNIDFEYSTAYADGAKGAQNLAKKLVDLCNRPKMQKFVYTLNSSIEEKIEAIAKNVYGASSIKFSNIAMQNIRELNENGFSNLPICISKNQYSFSDDAKKININSKFSIEITRLELSSGAGFIVAYTGSIIAMPGLPKKPAAEAIDVDENGEIQGLF